MFSQISDRWRIGLQLIFVLVLCAASIAIMISLGIMKSPSSSHRVQFKVETSGGVALITLEAGELTISKPTAVTVPWSKTVRIQSGTEVYLTASNPTQTGSLTCTIILDNVVWKTETTQAPKDGVACAGIVP